MIKEKPQIDPMPQPPVISKRNYEAEQYLLWLASDVQNIQTLGTNLFRGGMIIDSSELSKMKDALNKAFDEVEDDIKNLKDFLNNTN